MTKAGKFRFRFIALVMAICIFLISFVWLTAYTAQLQYEINKINKQIAETEKDIRTLEVKIKTASNITNIETRATELGLIYPSFDQVKYIEEDEDSEIHDLALALMETAYR